MTDKARDAIHVVLNLWNFGRLIATTTIDIPEVTGAMIELRDTLFEQEDECRKPLKTS